MNIVNLHPSKPVKMGPDVTLLYVKRSRNMRQRQREQHKLGLIGGGEGYDNLSFVDCFYRRYAGQVEHEPVAIFVLSKKTLKPLMGKEKAADRWMMRQLTKLKKGWFHFQHQRQDQTQDEEEIGGYDALGLEELIDDIQRILSLTQMSYLAEAELRTSQQRVNEKLVVAMTTLNKALLECFGGFGKSFLSLRNASQFYDPADDYCLCLTPVKDNVKDFQVGAATLSYLGRKVDVRLLSETREKDMASWIAGCKTKNWVPLLVATVQDIRGDEREEEDDDPLSEEDEEKAKEKAKKLDKRYAFLKDFKCSVLIRDEIHLHFAAAQTYRALEALNARKTLDMTATLTGREAATFGYAPESIVSFGLVQALEEQRKPGGDDKIKRLPKLELRAITGLTLTDEQKKDLRDEEGLNSTKIFAINHETKDFQHRKFILDLVAMTFSVGPIYGTGRKLWPQRICDVDTQTGAFMLTIPRGGDGYSASRKCSRLVELINTTFADDALAIDSYELTGDTSQFDMDLEQVVDSVRRKAAGRKVIIVTHRKLLTGVNIPQLEGIALWDKIGSQALFMQTWYRLFRYYPGKTKVVMAVYEPGVAIQDTSAAGAIGAVLTNELNKTADREARLKELEGLLSLTAYSDVGRRDVPAAELVEAYEHQQREAEKQLFGRVLQSKISEELGDEGLHSLAQCSFLGKGGQKGTGRATEITDDNGSKTNKSALTAPKEADGEDDESSGNQLKILCAMLEQLKLFAVHGAGGSMDSVEVASCSLVKGTWGEVNQELLLVALSCGSLKKWCDEHLRVTLENVKDGLLEVVGTLGPKQPVEGQEQIVLDNETVTSLVDRVRCEPRLVLTVNPKSGAIVRAVQKRWPGAKIWVVSETSTFDQSLRELGVTPLQVDEAGARVTIFNMKFDLVIGNPPYKAGMHLKFLELGLNHLAEGGELLFVHPAEWLVQKRDTMKQRKVYKPLRDRLASKQVDITLIDNPWPLDARLYVPLTISRVSSGQGVTFTETRTKGYSQLKLTSKTSVKLESLHNVTQWGSPKPVASFLKKVWQHQDRWEGREKQHVGGWYVNLCTIVGDGKTTATYDDGITRTIYNMFSLVNEPSFKVTTEPQRAAPRGGKEQGSEKVWFSFATEAEAQHALSFIARTKFMRAYLALIKIDQHGADSLLGDIPWLDWTQEWTDTKLASFFNLSAEELATIDEIVDTITL